MFRKSRLARRHKFLDIGCGIGSIGLQAAAWAGCQASVRSREMFFVLLMGRAHTIPPTSPPGGVKLRMANVSLDGSNNLRQQTLSCRLQGVEIVKDRHAGAVTLHRAFQATVSSDSGLRELLHPGAVENSVHLFKVSERCSRFGGVQVAPRKKKHTPPPRTPPHTHPALITSQSFRNSTRVMTY